MSNTVKVRKENKVKYVESGRLDSFLKQGYEQIDEDGNILKRATGGSSVPIAQYNLLLDKYEELEKSNDQGESLKTEIEELKKENTSLKSKIAKLEKASKQQDTKE